MKNRNLNIVITGGNKGIGKAIALRFAKAGYDIAICARNEKDLKKTESELLKINPEANILAVSCDVTEKKEIKRFANLLGEKFRHIDILVNNAGIYSPGESHKEPEGSLELQMKTNLFSAYYLTQLIIPDMMKRKQGYVFNMGSIAGLDAYKNGGAYGISKFALTGFSKNLREEMKPHGVRVTTLYLGAVLTDMWGKTSLPKSRFMKTHDIAELVYTCAGLSAQSVVEEIIVRPQKGDI